MVDVVGLSGLKRLVGGASSTTRVFGSVEKAHPTTRRDQARRTTPRERNRPTSVEGDVGHPQFVRPLGREVAADEIAGGMMVRCLRRDRRFCAG
jgi:hypothetical protein